MGTDSDHDEPEIDMKNIKSKTKKCANTGKHCNPPWVVTGEVEFTRL